MGSLPVLLFIAGTALLSEVRGQHHREPQLVEVCQEANWTFSWNISSHFDNHFLELQYTGPTYDKQMVTYPIATKNIGLNWNFNTDHPRYIGRLKTIGVSTFRLENVFISDAGLYAYNVSAPNTTGIDDTVYQLAVLNAENMLPTIVDKSSFASEAGIFKYTWKRPLHPETPLQGVRMAVRSEVPLEDRECFFKDDDDICSIEYKESDFGDYSGKVYLDTVPIYRPGTPNCKTVTLKANIAFTVDNTSQGTTKGVIIAVVVIVVLVVLVIVITITVLQYKKKQSHHIPLKDGLQLVTQCYSRIQEASSAKDCVGLYQKAVAESFILSFIQEYKKTVSESRAELLESISNFQLAAIVKYFLRQETTPWIPVIKQREITSNERAYVTNTDEFKSSDVSKMLLARNQTDDRHRFDILAVLFRHFHWLVKLKETHNIDEPMNADGIASTIAAILFKELPPSQTTGQIAFVKNVINHCEAIFTEDINRRAVQV